MRLLRDNLVVRSCGDVMDAIQRPSHRISFGGLVKD